MVNRFKSILKRGKSLLKRKDAAAALETNSHGHKQRHKKAAGEGNQANSNPPPPRPMRSPLIDVTTSDQADDSEQTTWMTAPEHSEYHGFDSSQGDHQDHSETIRMVPHTPHSPSFTRSHTPDTFDHHSLQPPNPFYDTNPARYSATSSFYSTDNLSVEPLSSGMSRRRSSARPDSHVPHPDAYSDLTTHSNPHVVHEQVKPHVHEVKEIRRTRSLHLHEHKTWVQPLKDPDPVVLPAQHWAKDLDTGETFRIPDEMGEELMQRGT